MKKGSKQSEDAKRKIREARKRQASPMLGKHHSKKTKKHWSIIRMGRRVSEETKQKISSALKGKMPKNIILLHKLRIGARHSNKSKEKMGLASRGRVVSDETREKLRRAGFRRKLSAETRKKIGDSHRGEKSVNWRGGITSPNDKIRHSIEYEVWRTAIFSRDGYTCQKYGTRGGGLIAHHILNFAQYPELRFAIDNGITLSNKAHIEFHKKYGKRNNTREQLEEFLSNTNI